MTERQRPDNQIFMEKYTKYKLVQKLVGKKWSTVHVINHDADHISFLDLRDYANRVIAIRILDQSKEVIDLNLQAKLYMEAVDTLSKRAEPKPKKKNIYEVDQAWEGKRKFKERVILVAKNLHGWELKHRVGDNEIVCHWTENEIKKWIKNSKAIKI